MTKKQYILDKIALFAVGLAIVSLFSASYVLADNNVQTQEEKIQEIYARIQAATGQTQDSVPLEIVDDPTINAFTDGTRVVIYQGLINYTHSWDEIAMVLGHETAHVMLHHLQEMSTDDPQKVAEMEANADKMGAFYALKAGYNVCEGRKLFSQWLHDYGNALGQNHPDFSYRFMELNINCGRD